MRPAFPASTCPSGTRSSRRRRRRGRSPPGSTPRSSKPSPIPPCASAWAISGRRFRRASSRRRKHSPPTTAPRSRSGGRSSRPRASKPNNESNRRGTRMKKALAVALAFLATEALGQAAAFPPPPAKVSPAAGVIDMHVHSYPDVFGRNMDDLDVAQLAKARGLRGILLKNHISETASRAALVMKVVPGIEVFGGIVLNKAVGGINPDAVEWMHRVYGGRGKVVWLPTFESDKHVKTFGSKDAKGLVVAPNGKVTPEMEAILKIIARENLLLATGHVHAEEVVAVVKRAKELGVKNIIVTHGLTSVPGLSMAQAKEVTSNGAVIEVCYLQFKA